MRLTVALCTWNRCGLLRETLESLTKLAIPDGVEWDLVVVNNNSTDDTAAVIDSFRNRLPLRPVFEPNQGISPARNAAIAAASGDYMLWTDDDVLVDTNWMRAYVAAITRRPGTALLGGPIRPRFEGEPPPWLVENLSKFETAFALLDLGASERALSSQGFNLPFGANYAARTDLHRKHRYDPAHGKVGKFMMFGEESYVMRNILADVPTGWWVPDAIVHHWVTKERQSFTYLRDYFEAQGRTRVQFGKADATPMIWGRPRWLWRSLVMTHARYWWRRSFHSPERWIESFIEAAMVRGSFEAYGMPAIVRR